jgi:hypothetical protein
MEDCIFVIGAIRSVKASEHLSFPQSGKRGDQVKQWNGQRTNESRDPYPTRLPPPQFVRKLANDKHRPNARCQDH